MESIVVAQRPLALLQQQHSFSNVLFAFSLVPVAVAAAIVVVLAAWPIYMGAMMFAMMAAVVMVSAAEAHFFHKRCLDLLEDNSNFHLNFRQLAGDACANHMEHHSDAMEWAVHSNRSISFGCHLELSMRMVSMTLMIHLSVRHTMCAVMLPHRLDPTHVCLYASVALVNHCLAHRNPNVLSIYYPTNRVNMANLNASMVVGMHLISHYLVQHFGQLYLTAVSEIWMSLKSSLWQHD